MNGPDHRQIQYDMISRDLQSAVNLRPEPQRSVLDKFSKMQSMSSLPSSGLTDPAPNSNILELKVLQSPQSCRVSGKEDKDKTRPSKYPLDPAPVVEFLLHDGDSAMSYLHSPFWFCTAALESSERYHRPADGQSSMLSGCLVSSLHKVKLTDNREHGLFIFGDLNAKVPGDYRLRFTLYELRTSANSTYVATMKSIESPPFTVFTGKRWPGQSESTQLSRHLCESGVKLRIRKETSKRKAQSQAWSADKKTAICSTLYADPLPGLMGPPAASYPIPRLMNGEEIESRLSRDGLNAQRDGLGIRNHMDQEAHGYLGGQQLPRPPPISPMGPPSSFSQQSLAHSRPLASPYRTANPGYLYQQPFSPESVSDSARFALGSRNNTNTAFASSSINRTGPDYSPSNGTTPGSTTVPSYSASPVYTVDSSNGNGSDHYLRQPHTSSPQLHRTSSSQEYLGAANFTHPRPPFLTRAVEPYQDVPHHSSRYIPTPTSCATSYNGGLVPNDPGSSLHLTRTDNLVQNNPGHTVDPSRNQITAHTNPGQSSNETGSNGSRHSDAGQTLHLARKEGAGLTPGWQNFQTTQPNPPRNPSIVDDFNPFHMSR